MWYLRAPRRAIYREEARVVRSCQKRGWRNSALCRTYGAPPPGTQPGIKGTGWIPQIHRGRVILNRPLPDPLNMPFRVNAKNFFITYPQCDTLPDVIADHIGGIRPVEAILAVREKHEDGNNHLHVLVQFVTRYDCKNERAFDFEECHPNIQPARNVADVKKYCLKGNPTGLDIYEEGDICAKRLWSEVIAAETAEEVHSLAKEISPRDYVLSYDRICSYADTKKNRLERYAPRFTDFVVPDEISEWVVQELRVRLT